MVYDRTYIKKFWIWYPGDFEIRHSLLQNLTREERGYDWPAYWHVDDCRKSVKFTKEFHLEEATNFTVHAEGIGYVEINKIKYAFNTILHCEPGSISITVFVANHFGLPCVYIDGDVIYSDGSWTVSDYTQSYTSGYDELYCTKDNLPNQVNYSKEKIFPSCSMIMNGGTLFDFGTVVNGKVYIEKLSSTLDTVTMCYGESQSEALDTEMCYYSQKNVKSGSDIRKRAFRYIFIPDCKPDDIFLHAFHEFIPKQIKARFVSDDELMNKIWSVSENTIKLCSDLFFIDGVKRDRWIWSGDAYQCYFINQYLFFNESINKRTIRALRGRDNIKQHINTIVDYSMLWLIGIEVHFLMTNDTIFLREIYKKMTSMVDYLENQTDEKGFIYGRECDWIFIDWADMDKDGVLCAEQLLLLKSYQVMISCGKQLGMNISHYLKKYEYLNENIDKYFWDDEKEAYIDGYESGKRNVTRHANIFAIIFDLASKDKKKKILNNVLLNDSIPQITTPYFKFFELDALCKLNELSKVEEIIRSYWGGMLELGATTFWEEFDPLQKNDAHYSMYGDPYGKSLCHAWGGSPIYLIGRYIIGVYPTRPGYERFTVEPKIESFNNINCEIPVNNGIVSLQLKHNILTVTSSRQGGVLIFNNKQYDLPPNRPVILER